MPILPTVTYFKVLEPKMPISTYLNNHFLKIFPYINEIEKFCTGMNLVQRPFNISACILILNAKFLIILYYI